jgi:hypothetical protein
MVRIELVSDSDNDEVDDHKQQHKSKNRKGKKHKKSKKKKKKKGKTSHPSSVGPTPPATPPPVSSTADSSSVPTSPFAARLEAERITLSPTARSGKKRASPRPGPNESAAAAAAADSSNSELPPPSLPNLPSEHFQYPVSNYNLAAELEEIRQKQGKKIRSELADANGGASPYDEHDDDLDELAVNLARAAANAKASVSTPSTTRSRSKGKQSTKNKSKKKKSGNSSDTGRTKSKSPRRGRGRDRGRSPATAATATASPSASASASTPMTFYERQKVRRQEQERVNREQHERALQNELKREHDKLLQKQSKHHERMDRLRQGIDQFKSAADVDQIRQTATSEMHNFDSLPADERQFKVQSEAEAGVNRFKERQRRMQALYDADDQANEFQSIEQRQLDLALGRNEEQLQQLHEQYLEKQRQELERRQRVQAELREEELHLREAAREAVEDAQQRGMCDIVGL